MTGPTAACRTSWIPSAPSFLLAVASALLVSGLIACGNGSAQEAFARYVECSEGMRAGNTVEVAQTCFLPDQLEVLSSLDDPAKFLASTRATDLRLLASGHDGGSVDGTSAADPATGPDAPDLLDLRVVGMLDGTPTAFRVSMQSVDGSWRIAAERLDVKSGALTGGEDGPDPTFELREDGRVVLDSGTGVWLSANGTGVPVFIVVPFFEGPEIQIDNLNAETAARVAVGDGIGVSYRTPDGPARVRGGELVVDEVTDGRMSGTLRLVVEPGRAGVVTSVEVELTFANMPMG